MTGLVSPTIGHNSAASQALPIAIDRAALSRIVAIRYDNGVALAVEQDGRKRRDYVLTAAALEMAELMAADVHRSRERLLALAAQLGEPVTPRRLAAPASFLARLVCGAGRQANSYTALGVAGEMLSRMSSGVRADVLSKAGGVTGLARQASPTRKTAAEPTLKSAPFGTNQAWTPGLAALVQMGERRVVAALLEVGGGAAPTVLVADVPGYVRLAKVEGRTREFIERGRLTDDGAGLSEGDVAVVAISRPVMAIVEAGNVRIEACATSKDEAAIASPRPHGEASE